MAPAHSHYRIDLDRIDWSEAYKAVAPDWLRTQHGYSREELLNWLDDYREVEHLIDSGVRRAGFVRMADSPDPRSQRMWRAYSYGFDPHHIHTDRVTVEWSDGRYRLADGTHRAVLAREEGFTHLPATVRARDQATLDTLRAQDTYSYNRTKPNTDRSIEPESERHRRRGR